MLSKPLPRSSRRSLPSASARLRSFSLSNVGRGEDAAAATPAAEAPPVAAARSIRASRRVRGATGRGVGAFEEFWSTPAADFADPARFADFESRGVSEADLESERGFVRSEDFDCEEFSEYDESERLCCCADRWSDAAFGADGCEEVEPLSLAAASPRNRGREEARRRRPAEGELGSFPFGPCLSGGISGKFFTPHSSLLVLCALLNAPVSRRALRPIVSAGASPEHRSHIRRRANRRALQIDFTPVH